MNSSLNSSERKWGRSPRSSIATVLGGIPLSIVVYQALVIISAPVTFGLGLNIVTAVVYGITILTASIAYKLNRGVVPTYILAAEVMSAAFYYDVIHHTDGTLPPPVNLTLQKSVPSAFVCLVLAIAAVALLDRTK